MSYPRFGLKRFWSKVIEGPGGCWMWLGARHKNGYADQVISGKHVLVHRWAYEHFRSPIPVGLEIDHLCRVRSCVNPSHMEAVTHLVNVQRGSEAQKTHCQHGHEFDDANTYRRRDNGARMCRACDRDRHRAKGVPS